MNSLNFNTYDMKFLKQLYVPLLVLVFASCVQEAKPKTITVKVDMTSILSPKGVGIRGDDPLSWDETTFLNDTDGDGIYEETFDIYTTRQDVEFKFVTNNNEFELQDRNNRSLTFEYKPETIVYKGIFDNEKDIIITKK